MSKEQPKLKKANLLPNVITAFGLCCGLFVLFKMSMTGLGEVTRELLTITAGILLLAALADLLDGAVARAMKVESEFGGFFDSIADAINFGVAPSVIVLKTLSIPPRTEWSYLVSAAAMIFSVCGVLRLVRFNVLSHRAAEDDFLMQEHKKYFTGLPIPAAAASLISLNLFLVSDELESIFSITPVTRAWVLFSGMLVLGYLMVSRLKFPSVKNLHIRVTSFYQVFLVVLFTVFVVFYGLMQHFSLVFVAIAWAYVFFALTLSLIRFLSGNKSSAEED